MIKWRFSLEPRHFLPVLSHIFGVEEAKLSRGAGVGLSLNVVFGWMVADGVCFLKQKSTVVVMV